MERYVSLDPGKTTGTCILEPSGHMVVTQASFSHSTLVQYLNALEPTVLIYESFQYRRIPNADLTAVELIGVIKLWGANSETKLVEQPPSSKVMWDDLKLKKMDLYKPRNPHSMDALRHMLYYVTGHPKEPLRDHFLNMLKES